MSRSNNVLGEHSDGYPGGAGAFGHDASSSGAALQAAAEMLAAEPYITVTLERIASIVQVPIENIEKWFPTMHALGAAVLDYERECMRRTQREAARRTSNPIERLLFVFRSIGDDLANDVVVRAGVRLAGESRQHFPERRLDPFAVWRDFVFRQLDEAKNKGLLHDRVNLDETVWLIVAAGMGTKDLLASRNAWTEAPARLEATLNTILMLVRSETSVDLRDG